MKLLNIIQLYKIIKSGNSGDLKEYSKSMSPEEVDMFRIKNPIIFKLIRWSVYYLTKDKIHNIGTTRTTPSNLLSNSVTYEKNMLSYVDSILYTINDWNVIDKIDRSNQGTFITLDYNTKTNQYDGFEDALQWTCYLAASISRIISVDYSKDRRDLYLELLKGVDKCLIVDANKRKYVIRRHPLVTIKKDLEPISQDMISGLVQLIAHMEYFYDEEVNSLEKTIKNKFNTIMEYHDYHLMYPDGTTNSYDLHPSYIYNHIKCFAYSAIRLSQGKFNKDDAKILRDMIQIHIPEDKPPYSRSWYGLVVAVNLIEAIIKLYSTQKDPNVDKVMDKLDFTHLALDWLKYYRSSTPEVHPELESVLFTAYNTLGHKDGKKETSKNVLKWINGLYDNKVIRKTNKEIKTLPVYNKEFALPPLFRHSDDYYWQRSAWRTGSSEEEHPVFDYVTPFSRILPFIYYQ